MHPFYPGIPSQNPIAAFSQQGNGNFNGGLPNSNQAQMQSPAGFVPNLQNQFLFNNPTYSSGYVNQRAPPDGRMGNSVLGSAPTMPHVPQLPHGGFSLPGPNSISGSSMNGPFGGMVSQNSIPGQWQVNSCMSGMNSNPGFVNGQFESQNLLQNVVNMLLQNPSQLNSLAQIAGCVNQYNPGVITQNVAIAGNPQLDLLQQMGAMQQQANLGQLNLIQSMLGVNQSMQMNSLPPTSGSLPLQQSQPMSLQANQGNLDEANVSNPNHWQNRPSNRAPNNSKFNSRNKIQKTHSQNAHEINANRNHQRNHGPQNSANEFKSGNHAPQNSANEFKSGNHAPHNSTNECNSGKRRSLVSLYTPQEIQQWCEERRKNYPTKANIDKKLVLNGKSLEDAENEAKLRRERLKEILAKQAELGFEVPEIPSHYLSDSEPKGNGRGTRLNNRNERFQKRPFRKNERFQSRYNNKRIRYNNEQNQNECSRNQHSQEEGGNSWKKRNASFTKRKPPSLLEKLLASDVKREKSYLLQAFRFMAMNSFFDDQSLENTSELKFPQVIVKEDARAVEGNFPSPQGDIPAVGSGRLVEELDGLVATNKSHDNPAASAWGLEQTEECEVEEGELTE